MKKIKKFNIILILIILSAYAVFTLINQQETLNQYSKNKEDLTMQIAEQNKNKEELNKQKEDVNSLDFIEQTAREKLDMYLPNEKVYVDQGI